jgi:hypothetical protein
MIPDAVFREFQEKTRRKLTVSGRNPPENARNPVEGSGDRIRLPVLTGFCKLHGGPDKSGYRIRSPEYCFHELPVKNPDPVGSLADCSTWVVHPHPHPNLLYAIRC